MKTINQYITEKIDPKGQWDKIDDFLTDNTLGQKIWDLLYKYQKSHNYQYACKISDLLKDTFKDIEFTITTPNTGKVTIKAFDKNEKLLDTLDEFEGNKINLYRVQEFLDKINQ